MMLRFLNDFLDKDRAFNYLEFGICFGTTFGMVMSNFTNANGFGLEIDPNRFEVCKWIVDCMGKAIGFQDRVTLKCGGILEQKLEPNSIDVVFMDTNHTALDDYDFIMHIINSGALREDFLFVGDDPTHSGTDESRKQFIDRHSDQYHIVTRVDMNLWWFKEHKYVQS